jgi:hypothetical protein
MKERYEYEKEHIYHHGSGNDVSGNGLLDHSGGTCAGRAKPGGIPSGHRLRPLEVFSALSGRREGSNPTWYQHSDYYICNSQGKRLEHVDNANGYYAQSPRVISLPPGKYLVKARAKDTLRIDVPVVIKPGEITRVHLDGDWQPLSATPGTKLVEAPAGYPVGWCVD